MNFEEVLTAEQAAAEVSAWLDGKNISPRKREEDGYKQAIDTLVDAMIYGNVTIDEDRVITHKLLNPMGNVTELKYQPRITTGAVQDRMKGVKGVENGRVIATLAALTGAAIGILNKMDTDDNSIAQAIVIFFL